MSVAVWLLTEVTTPKLRNFDVLKWIYDEDLSYVRIAQTSFYNCTDPYVELLYCVELHKKPSSPR